MLTTTHGFSGFSVHDPDAAERFYTEILGLEVTRSTLGILDIVLPGGARVIAYPKDDHSPAPFTILNFVVDDIDAAVAELEASGVTLENYGGYADERGIMRGRSAGYGPDVAWFLDPSGNILSVLAN